MSDGRSDAKYRTYTCIPEKIMNEELNKASDRLLDSIKEKHPDITSKSLKPPAGGIKYNQDTTVRTEIKSYKFNTKEYVKIPEIGGIKYDQDKTEYHYFSPIALEKINQILTFGAKKYAAHNWRGGFVWSRPFNACMRHLWAWWRGEDKDPETGLSHLAHAACCIMFLLEFEETKKDLDDRYKETK